MRFFHRAAAQVSRAMRHIWRSRKYRALLIILPLLGAAFFVAANFTELSEDVMFAIDPTAERGYRYGTLHMSANNPRYYDIERAQKFLESAREIDPTYPVLNYQLARIYFVQRHPILSLMSTNAEIRNASGTPIAQVYYMKGLIEGSLGMYDAAAEDYKTFLSLRTESKNGWAGYNDYAWVLLKGGKPEAALLAINEGLEAYPDNAWLLTIKTSTLFELGRFREALIAGTAAARAADALTADEWRSAYPGNDPRTTKKGLETIRRSAQENLEKIQTKLNATP